MPFRVQHIPIPQETSFKSYEAAKTGAPSKKSVSAVRDRYFLASRHLIGFGDGVEETSGPAPTAQPEKFAEEERAFKDRVNQAHEYFKNKQFKRAHHMFLNLAKTEMGRKNWKTQYYLAVVARKLSDLATAFPAARLAVNISQSKLEETKGKKLLTELENLFGPVTFQKSKNQKSEETKGYISIVAKQLVNKDKKEVHQKLVDYLNKTPLSFPTTLYLPFGDYEVNEVPLIVNRDNPNQQISVVIDPAPEDRTYVGEIVIGAGMLLLIAGGFMAHGEQPINIGGE